MPYVCGFCGICKKKASGEISELPLLKLDNGAYTRPVRKLTIQCSKCGVGLINLVVRSTRTEAEKAALKAKSKNERRKARKRQWRR